MTEASWYWTAQRRLLDLMQRDRRHQVYLRAVERGSNVAEELRCEPLTAAERAEQANLTVRTTAHRRAALLASGMPERFIDADGYGHVPDAVCRGCWLPVADTEGYIMQWSTRGGGVRWHPEHIPAALSVPGAHTERVIGNTGVPPAYPWPEDVFLQGGAHGVVMGKEAAYATAFVEAFPTNPSTFIRGEGATVAGAETAAWEQYRRYMECATAPEHGPWEKRGYTNGGGFCGTCGLFQSDRFTPVPDDGDPGPLERLFLGLDGPEEIIRKAVDVDPEVGQ